MAIRQTLNNLASYMDCIDLATCVYSVTGFWLDKCHHGISWLFSWFYKHQQMKGKANPTKREAFFFSFLGQKC